MPNYEPTSQGETDLAVDDTPVESVPSVVLDDSLPIGNPIELTDDPTFGFEKFDKNNPDRIHTEVAGQPVDALLNFFSAPSLADAFAQNGWSLGEEVAIVSQIARGEGGPKATPSHQLQAIAWLNRRALQSLKLSGHLETKTATATMTSNNGSSVELTTRVTTLTAGSISRMDAAMQTPLAGSLEVIDALPIADAALTPSESEKNEPS